MIKHKLQPWYGNEIGDTGNNARVLLLGSFPSTNSEEAECYYGDKNNNFWTYVAKVYGVVPQIKNERFIDYKWAKEFCKAHHLALYDVIEECDSPVKNGKRSSEDSDLKNIIPAFEIIKKVIEDNKELKYILINSALASETFEKYIRPYLETTFPERNLKCISFFPSTSKNINRGKNGSKFKVNKKEFNNKRSELFDKILLSIDDNKNENPPSFDYKNFLIK